MITFLVETDLREDHKVRLCLKMALVETIERQVPFQVVYDKDKPELEGEVFAFDPVNIRFQNLVTNKGIRES